MTKKNYNQKIQEALDEILERDSKSLLLGLGISDPKRFFGTTESLLEKYGSERIIECPTSENTYLGHSLGLALGGHNPIVHFQRVDFMLYAFDQLINNITKWNDMFAREKKFNLVVRALVGMGWGQGAQHSQNYANWFSSLPGMTVIAPTCGESAKQLLKQASHFGSPVIQLEHRWLQYLETSDEKEIFEIGKAKIRRIGNAGTIVSWSYGVVESLRFIDAHNLDIEVVDLLTLSSFDMETILNSANKTKKVLIWEPGILEFGIGAELKCKIIEMNKEISVERLGYKKVNVSSSVQQIHHFYPDFNELTEKVSKWLSINLVPNKKAEENWPVDQDKSHWKVW
jgi:pyruvate/2-oxoglutarate/acetoin dehydrogenase E1 component